MLSHQTKKPHRSLTLWFNLAVVIAGLYLPNLSEGLRQVIVTLGLTNIGLRFKTKEAIK